MALSFGEQRGGGVCGGYLQNILLGVCLFHEALFFLLLCRLWKLATVWQVSGFRATGFDFFCLPNLWQGVLNQEKLEESHEEGIQSTCLQTLWQAAEQ